MGIGSCSGLTSASCQSGEHMHELIGTDSHKIMIMLIYEPTPTSTTLVSGGRIIFKVWLARLLHNLSTISPCSLQLHLAPQGFQGTNLRSQGTYQMQESSSLSSTVDSFLGLRPCSQFSRQNYSYRMVQIICALSNCKLN